MRRCQQRQQRQAAVMDSTPPHTTAGIAGTPPGWPDTHLCNASQSFNDTAAVSNRLGCNAVDAFEHGRCDGMTPPTTKHNACLSESIAHQPASSKPAKSIAIVGRNDNGYGEGRSMVKSRCHDAMQSARPAAKRRREDNDDNDNDDSGRRPLKAARLMSIEYAMNRLEEDPQDEVMDIIMTCSCPQDPPVICYQSPCARGLSPTHTHTHTHTLSLSLS
ncbi:hypothetical protein BC831DRAFT_506823, partial [Entophlyctis helioformis]